MILFKNAELILEALSLVVTTDAENQLSLVEFAEMETKVIDGKDNYAPNGNKVTVSLDYEELDEVIALLQDASRHLKRKDKW